MTIISLHLPKTAGTSFKASLEGHFGERYRDDYVDQAISKTPLARGAEAIAAAAEISVRGIEDVECIHGHFLPLKYLLYGCRTELTFVTWMRDPAIRMLSHYYYWLASYDRHSAVPHHRQVVEQKWTLEQFCFSKQFRNIYSQYLWGFPLENFSFIGISEHYAEDLQDFSRRFLGFELKPCCQNSTIYPLNREPVSEAFLQQVRDYHAADMRLYERALEWRSKRLSARGQLSVASFPKLHSTVPEARSRRGSIRKSNVQ